MASAAVLERAPNPEDLLPLLSRYWGYDGYRPHQAEAIGAALSGRDSLVVLPTGGGKSMCFQLPALALEGTAVVISPLLALMKDQVDGLVASGISAAALNSSLEPAQRREVVERLRAGEIKLLYLSPERLGAADTAALLREAKVSFFAIDEAHCVSQWGHEFRPDYRQLSRLREWFPRVPVHAFTATATPQVRADVVEALRLRDPEVIVGSFDRPNLTYRAVYRRDALAQVQEVIARHPKEAGIVYCIRRKDVDAMAASLRKLGHKALPYHAGMEAEARRRNQEAFLGEEVDIVVATVAFGMGIDRSDVRFVVHAAMPKSLEAYQQEAGRAGRDGLESECVLLYDASDRAFWRQMYGTPSNEYERNALRKVDETYLFARALACRHRALVEYFGQPFEAQGCGACDVCLGEQAVMEDSSTVARKILSCVARVKEGFGARYVAEVLKGSKSAKIRERGHDALSTHGLLAEHPLEAISDWADQLVAQGFLRRDEAYGTLQFTPAGVELLKGQGEVRLTNPRRGAARKDGPLSGEEEGLFGRLREWRRSVAQERGVPPYLIFGDATLRELATRRPGSEAGLRGVKGIGEAKARDFGAAILEIIRDFCAEGELTADESAPVEPSSRGEGALNAQKAEAMAAFAQGLSVAEAMARSGRAESTVVGYLLEHLQQTGATSGSPWVDDATVERVLEASRRVKAERLKPIYEALGGEVPYGVIRIALAVGGNRVAGGTG